VTSKLGSNLQKALVYEMARLIDSFQIPSSSDKRTLGRTTVISHVNSTSPHHTTALRTFSPILQDAACKSQLLGDISRQRKTAINSTRHVATWTRNGPSFENLPLEIRYQIYEVLISKTHLLCLSFHDVRQRRLGILEALSQTSQQFRDELSRWTLGRQYLVRNRMWGLFNPHLTQVCVRYTDWSGYATYVYHGMPLTPEICDRIALWWQCMKTAKSDRWGAVNNEMWEFVMDGIHYCSLGYKDNEDQLRQRMELYLLKPKGDYIYPPVLPPAET
jgi:hypothetical protein